MHLFEVGVRRLVWKCPHLETEHAQGKCTKQSVTVSMNDAAVQRPLVGSNQLIRSRAEIDDQGRSSQPHTKE